MITSPAYRGGLQRRLLLTKWTLTTLVGLLSSLSALAAEGIPTPSLFGLDTMAPESGWGIRFEQRTNRYDARYDHQGKRVGLGDTFDGVNLNSQVFSSLALLGANASLGTTRFNTETTNQISVLTLGYGLNANLTFGAIIPYVSSATQADLNVAGGNVGFNPAFNSSQPISAGNFPFAPAGAGVPPLNSAGVQQILTNPAFGYAYKAIGNQRSEGLSDPTFGVLWRAIRSPKESLIIGLGVRPGIAKKDDPDNLLDMPTGDGSTDIRSRLEYFLDFNHGIDMRLLADYNWQTTDQATMRIPEAGQTLALASSKQRLKRDLGDFYEADVEFGYRVSNWRMAATYHRYEKQSDSYRSSLGTDTTAIERDTYTRADQYRLSATWSGVQAWQQGKLPLPIIVKLEMQDTTAGRNFVDVRDVYIQITTLFK